MSLNPGTPNRNGGSNTPTGPLTPNTIATKLSELDLPAPSSLNLAIPSPSAASASASGAPDSAASFASAQSHLSEQLAHLNLPEPEALQAARAHKRTESRSQDIAETLSRMNLPQPEHIFGPDEGGSAAPNNKAPAAKQGVRPEDWENVMQDEVPEAVKSPALAHARRESRSQNNAPSSTVPPSDPATAATHTPAASASASAKDQKITPFDVQGAVDADGKELGIDYDKLANKFGAIPVDHALLERFERLTGRKPHPLMRRGTYYCHRDFSLILDRYERGEQFYLYTGRGPSSDSMHMGHLIPFLFTAWLQEVFDCACVIQVTDDEKYLLDRDAKKQQALLKKAPQDKRGPYWILDKYYEMGQTNIADIIACGFKQEKTFIFSDLDFVGREFYRNVVLMAKTITNGQAKGVFGFSDSDNIGMYHFAAVQSTPSFCNSFPQIFGARTDIPALIPCAIDQDPYFLLCRDAAEKLKYRKPALLLAKFLPALQGAGTKMSASQPNTCISLSDQPNEIRNKIRRHAFSGGGATQEEHQRNGGNPDVDVAYAYLGYFEEDDEKMARLAKEYRAGTLSTVQMKDECIAKLTEVVAGFQERRAQVTPEAIRAFQDATRAIDPSLRPPASVSL
ncbi:tryptophan--tRNA ligase [Cryptotrichosporon argae]